VCFMRPSALKMGQNNKDILKGFWVLILVVLLLFLFRTAGVNYPRGRILARQNFFVQIEGDIKNPGVYCFDQKDDISRLIERGQTQKPVSHSSGGVDDVLIHSGSKVTFRIDSSEIRYINEEMSSFYKITLGMPVSINMETRDGLVAVPGIGPLLAESIVNERRRQGGFKTLEDLRSVHGIGEKTYKKIITYLTL